MRIYLDETASKFCEPVEYITGLNINLSLTDSKDAADFIITVNEDESSKCINVKKNQNKIKITYSKKHEFFRALLILLKSENISPDLSDYNETPEFNTNGIMIDNSRNAVLTVEKAKQMIVYAALLGFDNIQLYNEDTFEVSGEPYFGYMRMRYTQDEVRELNDFAEKFGIKVIPCIQTLGHLNQIFKWDEYSNIHDIDDVVLAGEPATYELIENIISSWRSCVDSDYIHIGMDEAYNVGKGRYTDIHGVRPRFEIMCGHLEKVIEICKKYNFKPMMWSDMFFRLIYGDYYASGDINPELLKMVPKDIIMVYWDYYSLNADEYDAQMKKHLKFPNELCFAGGAWKWSGFLPATDHSLKVSELSLAKAKENGIKNIMVTAWGDNGAECPITSVLAVFALFSEASYHSDNLSEHVSQDLKVLTGYSLDEFLSLTKPNNIPGEKVFINNSTKYLLYQDVLMGLFDKHVGNADGKHFKKCADEFEVIANDNREYSYIFKSAEKLCRALEIKCDLGVRLKKAYDANDTEKLRNISEREIPELLIRLDDFHSAFKKQWYRENKTGGFDIQDIRIGGLRARIKSAPEIINMYLNGEILKIEELEQERLTYYSNNYASGKNISYNIWSDMISANIL